VKKEAFAAGAGRSGLLLALAGFGIFALGDGLTKSTAGLWPGVAAAALRFTLGAMGLGLILLWREGVRGFRMPRPLIQIGRGTAMAVSTACLFTAFQWMPLATATAIGFTAPLLTALLSALLLREHIPMRIWSAIALAMVGVMLALRPSFGALGAAALLPLLAALGMATLMMLNRAVAGSTPALLSQVLVASIAAPILIAIAVGLHVTGKPAFHIGLPGWPLILKVMTVTVSASIGHWLVYAATMRATAAMIAPANYIQLPIAITLGWIGFGDVPDWPDMIGIALIVIAGTLLMRKQDSGRHAAE
jgi:drug/metabolite transporter (DMT)-like permease